MTGRKSGVVAKLREKVHTENGWLGLWTLYCIIHEMSLCSKSLKMDHVMEVVVKTANFVRAGGLSHHQFDNLSNDESVSHHFPYHIEVRLISRGIGVKRFCNIRGKIVGSMKIKWMPEVQLQFLNRYWTLHLQWI